MSFKLTFFRDDDPPIFITDEQGQRLMQAWAKKAIVQLGDSMIHTSSISKITHYEDQPDIPKLEAPKDESNYEKARAWIKKIRQDMIEKYDWKKP